MNSHRLDERMILKVVGADRQLQTGMVFKCQIGKLPEVKI
jgi:hypothetical protein